MSLPAVTQRCCWTRLDGISPPSSPYPTTSRSYRCRRNPPNSHGGSRVKEILGYSVMTFYSPEVLSDPRSEPFDVTRLVAELDQTHIRPASTGAAPISRLQRAWLRRVRPFSTSACEAMFGVRSPTRICRD